MRTLLLSTTTNWNCGDDFIRWGVLRALGLSDDVRVLWWNRGWGIEGSYGNARNVNLDLADAIVFAGTPEWVDKNVWLWAYAARTGLPVYLLGVGGHGGFRAWGRHIAAATDQVRLAIARDGEARNTLMRAGVTAEVLSDPALFVPPADGPRDTAIIGWRGIGDMHPERPYEVQEADRHLTRALLRAWQKLAAPKAVVVHDNREVAAAERLFGADSVYYSSDPRAMWRFYGRCRYYVGARIHGVIPALVHGAPCHLLYNRRKGACLHVIRNRLGLWKSVEVTFLRGRVPELRLDLEPPKHCGNRYGAEMKRFRGRCLATGLKEYT